MSNLFLEALQKGDTTTENGAISNSTTGDVFLDDFAQAGTFRNRSFADVRNTMAMLWAADPQTALQAAFFLRTVTRKVKYNNKVTEKVQKGSGLKDEFLMRFLWIAEKSPETFYKNLLLMVAVGSWKDFWQLIYYSEEHKVELDLDKMFALAALSQEEGLFLKYMPLEKSKTKLKTPRAICRNNAAKAFRQFLGATPKEMRALKVSGDAHVWQQLIARKEFSAIEWGLIPGKALSILTSNDFLANHKLEKSYLAWLDKQPVAKFTGYPHELTKNLREAKRNGRSNYVMRKTVDKQFQGLLDLAKEDQGAFKGNVFCALDTSGSMECSPLEDGTTPFDICVAMGIYFSSLNTGAFADHVCMFDNNSKLLKLGGTMSEKFDKITGANIAWGGTNFQSVIDLLVRIREQKPNIPVQEYPTTIVVISDMQFNGASGYGYGQRGVRHSTALQSNYERAMQKLEAVGLPEVSIIWWQVRPNGVKDFPSDISDKGAYHFSGYDGAILTNLLGKEPVVNEKGEVVKPTPLQVMSDAYNQEILQYCKL